MSQLNLPVGYKDLVIRMVLLFCGVCFCEEFGSLVFGIWLFYLFLWDFDFMVKDLSLK